LSAQTCTATYGDNACICDIENFCLTIDCSAYLPGAKMDTCQHIQIEDEDGTASFIPSLEIFQEDFEGLTFENIDWEIIDWENLDWNNFNFDNVNWGIVDWVNTQWEEIIGVDVDESILCPVLEHAISMSREFGTEGSCTCDSNGDGGFDMDCWFAEVCADDTLCGSVGLAFGFDNIGSVEGNVCATFPQGEHLETCYSYSLPVADQNSMPECSAKYGGEACACEIDENFCLKIDCSDHEPTAVTESCQVLSMNNPEANSFIPNFSTAGSITDDSGSEESETGVDIDSNENETETTGNEVEKGASSPRFVAWALALASILVLYLCFRLRVRRK